jgi:hypothetical protein
MKYCTNCKQTKPLTEFYVDKRVKTGRSYRCSACHKQRVLDYNATPKGKARLQTYYLENRDKILETNRQWRRDHTFAPRKMTLSNKADTIIDLLDGHTLQDQLSVMISVMFSHIVAATPENATAVVDKVAETLPGQWAMMQDLLDESTRH